MKRQKLIGETEGATFDDAVNEYLKRGWKIVPGCVYATAAHSKDYYIFTITLWKDGIQKMLTSPNFFSFINHVNSYLDLGYYVVVGSLYAASIGRNESKVADNYIEQFFINVVGEE